MVTFNLWGESFIFAAVYSVIIIVSCVIAALIGRKMITQLGLYPTQTPAIQMSVILKLVTLEIVTFTCLIVFYRFFSS